MASIRPRTILPILDCAPSVEGAFNLRRKCPTTFSISKLLAHALLWRGNGLHHVDVPARDRIHSIWHEAQEIHSLNRRHQSLLHFLRVKFEVLGG